MKKKKCSKCNIEKSVKDFYKNKNTYDGLTYQCKECQRKYSRQYKRDNYPERRAYDIKWRKKNKDHFNKWSREFMKAKYDSNEEFRKETIKRTKKYYKDNQEERLEYQAKYREENREKCSEKSGKWFLNNKDRVYKRKKERYDNDPIYNLNMRLRSRTYLALKNKGMSKDTSTRKLIGCSWEELKKHIENLFTDGMNWDNKGEWEVDHEIPLSSANTKKELYELCHYTNLQPLWREENRKKGSKIMITKN